MTGETNGNFIRRHKKAAAATLLAMGGAALVPRGWHAFENSVHPKSAIVAGVPAQVENHSYSTYCASRINTICTSYGYNYFLGLEQCPEDIAAARQGKQAASFDPKIGEMRQGCAYDQVQVSSVTWDTWPNGSVIVFDGSPDEHLRK